MEWVFAALVILPVLLVGGALGIGYALRPRDPPNQLPVSYMSAANAGVLRDEGATDFHFRARRGEREYNVFRDGPTMELYVDLDISPRLKLELDDAATTTILDGAGFQGIPARVHLETRRLVLTAELEPEERRDPARALEALERIAERVEARYRLEACPRCFERGFEPGAGALHEDLCHLCGGRFFGPAVSPRLFERLGLETADLRAAVEDAERTDNCPACGHDLRAADLGDVGAGIELCVGCGSAWLAASATEVLERAGLARGAKQG